MRAVCLFAMSLTSVAVSAAEPTWESAIPSEPARSAVAGTWTRNGTELSVRAAQGARLALRAAPSGDYDFQATFTRQTGQHSIGLIVVHGGRQVVFEVDAWGSHLAGFQDVAGKSIRENPTRREGVQLENGKRHTITVEVRRGRLRGLLDGKELAKLDTDGSNLSIHDVWRIPGQDQLGLVAWDSDTVFHSVQVRSLPSDPKTAATPAPTRPGTTPATAPAGTTRPEPGRTTPGTTPATPASAQRVLIVIANHHFFYREYGDPRQELERAGIRVTVAAGRKASCHPHPGSGQGPDGGVVEADLALRDVKAENFDAVLFSGGWGASAYQFAFNGRYNEVPYNGDRATKTEANRIINEFLSQDKYVCGLCNGVSVLAWARVNGKSPLAGKRVCAPVREAPPGVYNGRPGQPSCRWHAEVNGATLSPAGSIGGPGSADDVLVDGRIITGEDDPSAREMGRRLVEVLTRPAAASN